MTYIFHKLQTYVRLFNPENASDNYSWTVDGAVKPQLQKLQQATFWNFSLFFR